MPTPIILNCLIASQPDISCRQGATVAGGFPNNIKCSSILGAADGSQTMQSEYSTIVMGCGNAVRQIPDPPNFPTGVFNTIVNGCFNSVSGYFNGILNGADSHIYSVRYDQYNAILSGERSTNYA